MEALSISEISIKLNIEIEGLYEILNYLSGKDNNWLIRIIGKNNMLEDMYAITFDGSEYLSRVDLQKLQEKQTVILEQQGIFTKILALATLILGVTALLNFFNIKITPDSSIELVLYPIAIAMFTGFGFVVLFGAFLLLIIEARNLIFKK